MEVECGWKPRETCKGQAENLPTITGSDAVSGAEGRRCWPGGCSVDGSVGGRAAPGAGGVDVGTGTAPSKGTRLTREVVSLPSTPFPGQRGSRRDQSLRAGDATDVRWSLLGPCMQVPARIHSQAGSQLALPSALSPLLQGHESSSARSSSKPHQGAPGSPPAATKTAQSHCTPHLP